METKRLVDSIQIASPCPQPWEAMEGDNQVRFCSLCQLNVYNLAGMTDDAADSLIREHEGKRLCVRIYRRSDGTVITKDCPVGLRAARLQVVRMLTAVAGIFLFGCVSALGMFGRNRQRAADTSAGALLERWSRPDPDPALAAEIDALIRAEMSRATIGSVAESGVMAEIDLDNQPQVQPHDR